MPTPRLSTIDGSDVTYLRSLAIDEALGCTDPTASTFVLADGLDSTLALTDASGAIATSYTYAPLRRDLRLWYPLGESRPVHRPRERRDGLVLLPGAVL